MHADKGDNNRIKLYGIAPWVLGSACILLLLLLAIFAISNYEREKNLIKGALEQKGLTLIRFINSAVGDSFRSSMRSSSTYEKWEVHMQSALELAIEQPGVESIVLIDRNANILLSVGEDNAFAHESEIKRLELRKELLTVGPLSWRTRIIESPKDGSLKAIISTVYRLPSQHAKRRGNNRNMMGEGRFRHSLYFESFSHDMKRVEELIPVYLVQLDVADFSGPLRRQFIQILLELLAILLVGVGGTLSFYTLRGLKGSEDQLKKIRSFNDTLVSSLPIGLIATGEDNTLHVVNNTAEKIVGIKLDQVVSKTPGHCLPLPLAGLFTGASRKNDSGLDCDEHSKEIIFDGKTLDVTVFPVETVQEKPVGEVMILRDITEVKRLEKDLQRSERLAVVGKMAAGVAHELRNPLSSIKGLALLLQSKINGSGDDEDIAETFVGEVDRLNRSIGELLDYAKPSNLNLQSCSLESVLNKTLSLIGPDLESSNVTVHLECKNNIPQVLIDKDKISQVILNIILNALQAIEEVSRRGNITICLETAGDYVSLKIADNGIGILPENLGKVFDPYFTSKSSGTGLGLALSLKTVEEHGGKLQVLSGVEGTELQLLLPLP